MEKITFRYLLSLALLFQVSICAAQDASVAVRTWLLEQQEQLGLSLKDVTEWQITSTSTDKKGITYVYINQQVHGLQVYNAVANFAVRDGAVVHFGNRLLPEAAIGAPSPVPDIGATDALRSAADEMELSTSDVHVLRTISPLELVLSPSGISHDPIPAKLIYQPIEEGGLRLAWDLTIRSVSSPNWWHLAVDAITGRILRTTDHIVHCAHAEGAFSRPYDALDDLMLPKVAMAPMPVDGSGYRVFPYPTESPSHGPSELRIEPADEIASPYGWHDTNGQPGPEYTITRGNNVHAYEDINDFDFPGYSPDGGVSLNFDFGFSPQQQPIDYLDASITNLFFACNVLHDLCYHYGFDEQSGNFQENNYGNGGWDSDPVIAEAQDGGGMNNANFATPPDGSSGRMQMYLWRIGADSTLFINSPPSIEGVYWNLVAGFGPPLPTDPITEDVVLVVDATPPVNDACDPILNTAALAGKIALVDRGQCTFVSKVEALQNAGAIAVIVVNNVPGEPVTMGGTGGGSITIPSVMISQNDGDLIKQALLDGPVNATLIAPETEELRDSSFDNGIIAHEFGHGVSIRLTGGGLNVDCLWNDEQMGEGWSDYLGMIFTMRPNDLATTPRGVGTFSRGQATDGQGIRPAPYTTDFTVNGYTYGDTNDPTLSQPHGVGFVWATMLWDLTWAMIGEHGLDSDWYTGTGGNNMAIQLIMDGMKLQPCNPGFVDGRDAILQADALNYGGANECLIWDVFAQRGLGYSADQGSPFDRFDQLEAFDLPPACLTVEVDERQALLRGFNLMPNPANGQVQLMLAQPFGMDATVRILGADGRVVRSDQLRSGSVTFDLDLAGIAPALYVVELRAGEVVLKERLVVN